MLKTASRLLYIVRSFFCVKIEDERLTEEEEDMSLEKFPEGGGEMPKEVEHLEVDEKNDDANR